MAYWILQYLIKIIIVLVIQYSGPSCWKTLSWNTLIAISIIYYFCIVVIKISSTYFPSVCDVICNLPLVHLKVFVSQLFRKLSRRFRELENWIKPTIYKNFNSEKLQIPNNYHFERKRERHTFSSGNESTQYWEG